MKQKEGTIHDALGRWIGIILSGKAGRQLRVISAYWPLHNEHLNGAYQHQVEYYATKCLKVDPIAQFDTDMNTMITEWISNSKRVIVMINL